MISKFKRGEIINVDLGQPPKEVKGHEQGMERPCIIIKPFNNLKLLLVVPCTSKKPKYPLFTIVSLSKETSDLSVDSYALCHQLRTISFDRVSSVRGRLSSKDFGKIHAVLIDILS
ncbi:MAG: type II toxin-antitoxin system PemK/MazF family toxin [Chitinophagales bacterium]